MEIRKTNTTTRGPYRSNYTRDDLDNAYRLVLEDNLSAQRAAARWGVPVSTLKDRLLGNISLDTVKSGPMPLFTAEEESFLSSHIRTMGEIGYGYTRQETINLASDYAIHLGYRDRQHPLSLRWLYNFLDRWPELKVQKPRKLEAARARSATKENIDRYFEELSKVIQRHNLHNSPHAIFNIDEKGLSTDVTPPKIVAGTRCKPQTVTSGKSKTVTLIAAVNAAGGSVPPYFVFPGQRMREELLSGASPGSSGTVTETGWSNTEVFSNYMKTHLARHLPSRSRDTPVLILYNGHKSHVSLGLIEWAQENHIILFVLPPHTSHLLQPLDIGCYGPFETTWIRSCHTFLRENSGKAIGKQDVCAIACRVFNSTLTPTNVLSSFRKSGIFPLNPEVVDNLIVMPARSFTRQPLTETNSETPARTSTISDQENQADSACNFLESRGGEVLKNFKTYKPRNTLSKIVGGRAITDQKIVEQITKHKKQHPQKLNKVNNIEKKDSCVAKSLLTSLTTKGKSTQNKTKGKRLAHRSKKQKTMPQPNTFTDSFSDSATDDEELCCVCGKFTPDALRRSDSITFVKWAQCDRCGHWVHLAYCTTLTVVRTHTTFFCPHCEQSPVEE